MNRAIVRSGAFVLFVFAILPRLARAGQTTGAPPPSPQTQVVTPASSAQSPESKIYQAAQAIKDPAEKLAALRKFQADYPTKSLAQSADSGVLTLLLANFKDRTE